MPKVKLAGVNPSFSVSMGSNQYILCSFRMYDDNGQYTESMGTYGVAWSVDDPTVLKFLPGPATPGGGIDPLTATECLVGPATNVASGTSTINLVLHSSDPANHPDLMQTGTVTVAYVPSDVASVSLGYSGPFTGSF